MLAYLRGTRAPTPLAQAFCLSHLFISSQSFIWEMESEQLPSLTCCSSGESKKRHSGRKHGGGGGKQEEAVGSSAGRERRSKLLVESERCKMDWWESWEKEMDERGLSDLPTFHFTLFHLFLRKGETTCTWDEGREAEGRSCTRSPAAGLNFRGKVDWHG